MEEYFQRTMKSNECHTRGAGIIDQILLLLEDAKSANHVSLLYFAYQQSAAGIAEEEKIRENRKTLRLP